MRWSSRICCYALSLFTPLLLAAPAQAAALGEPERIALARLAATADAAWNARDADAMASLYAADATLRVGDAAADGRDGVRDYFRSSFARLAPDLRHETTVVGLHAPSPDVVLADTRVELTRLAADGSSSVVRRFTTITLLVRSGDGWRFAGVRAFPQTP